MKNFLRPPFSAKMNGFVHNAINGEMRTRFSTHSHSLPAFSIALRQGICKQKTVYFSVCFAANVTVKTAPFPGALSTAAVPPIASAEVLTIYSPRPLEPSFSPRSADAL